MAVSVSAPAGSSGRWLRQARRAAHLSQAALARPDFSPSHASAIERGQFYPSDLALTALTQRLISPPSPGRIARRAWLPPPLDALDQDLAYQLDHARALIMGGHAPDALPLLTPAPDYQPYLPGISVRTRYRWHRLRALAYVGARQPARARSDLNLALTLAQQLGDPQEVARARNALGAALYAQDLPHHAWEQHSQCLQAVHAHVVKDLNLRVSIVRNLANDYLTLNDPARAGALYAEARTLLNDLDDPARQAAVAWGSSQAYQALGDLPRALLYARQAVTIYEAGDQLCDAAEMSCNLAEMLGQHGEYDAAADYLDRARALLEGADQPMRLSTLYAIYAEVELRRDRLTEAELYACRSVAFSAPVSRGGCRPSRR